MERHRSRVVFKICISSMLNSFILEISRILFSFFKQIYLTLSHLNCFDRVLMENLFDGKSPIWYILTSKNLLVNTEVYHPNNCLYYLSMFSYNCVILIVMGKAKGQVLVWL